MTYEEAKARAKTLGCTHVVRSEGVTHPDSMGYAGGERVIYADHFGRYTADGTFLEHINLGLDCGAHGGPRTVTEFPGGRAWSRAVLLAHSKEEVL